MKIDRKIMRAYLDLAEHFRKIMITDYQIQIVKDIERSDYGSITSSELAKQKGISVSNASMHLRRLYQIGYLTRTEHVDPTGGIIHRYRSAVHV